jgi:NAD(P)-dependent dehydrogenase (short-subunit alcohol dehydrogenase family)
VLVTGAAGTIGEAIASCLAVRGARLALTDLDRGGLDRLAGRVGLDAADVFAAAADARSAEETSSFVVEAVARLGRIDACVLAAGIEGPVAPVDEVGDDDLAAVFDVNVHSMFRILRVLLPIFREQGDGRIVTIASGAGTAGAPFLAAYAASKHAVVGLTRTVALEEARAGISINAVCPGMVASPMMSRIDDRLAALQGGRAADPDDVPMGRYADPAEVAELVAYLALDAPAYLTGTAIPLDGGFRV